MVRAGVVTHPSEWEMSGFNEIQNPPERYGVIDLPDLRNLCGIPDPQQFSEQHRQWIQETLNNGINQRESCWTESIAVGGPGFVEEIKTGLGMKGIGRRIEDLEAGRCVLREEFEPYSADFELENGVLNPINSYLWDVF